MIVVPTLLVLLTFLGRRAIVGEVPDHPAARRLYILIGERVRRRRDELELTQEALAKRASAKRSTISNLERGRQHVPLHVLQAVANALGWDVHALLPTRADLAAAEGVPWTVGGVVKTVALETPQLVESMLARAEKEARRG